MIPGEFNDIYQWKQVEQWCINLAPFHALVVFVVKTWLHGSSVACGYTSLCLGRFCPHINQSQKNTIYNLLSVNINLILQIPDSIPVCELLKCCATLGQDATFKSTHVEQKIWIVLAVDRHEALIPRECRDRSWQAVLDIPEHSTPKINIMLHEPHASISGPALPVIVAHNVFIVRIRVLCEVALDQITSFFSWKPAKQVLDNQTVYSVTLIRLEEQKPCCFSCVVCLNKTLSHVSC